MKTPIVGRTFMVTSVAVKVANSETDMVRTEDVRLYRNYSDEVSAKKAAELSLRETGRMTDSDTVISCVIQEHETEKREMEEADFIKNSVAVSVQRAACQTCV